MRPFDWALDAPELDPEPVEVRSSVDDLLALSEPWSGPSSACPACSEDQMCERCAELDERWAY